MQKPVPRLYGKERPYRQMANTQREVNNSLHLLEWSRHIIIINQPPMTLLTYSCLFRIHHQSEDTSSHKPRPDGGVSLSVQVDRATAQVAGLEDQLERESSEKRDLQNQVRVIGTTGLF
jgi:hypothetical protein